MTGAQVKSTWRSWAILLVGVVALQIVFSSADHFPDRLDTTISDPIDRAGGWMRANRRSHWLFTRIFSPLSSFVDAIISRLEDVLLWAPWFVVIAVAVALPVSKRMWREAAVVGG